MPDPRSTTVSVLTPPGRGAIAVIAVDGPQSGAWTDSLFTPASGSKLSQRPFDRIVYGRWGVAPSEDVIICRRAPDRVEIHCHGGSVASRRIVEDIVAMGGVATAWQRWAAAHELSTVQRAARIAIAEATTERAAAVLLDQYQGALETETRRVLALVEVGRSDEAGRALRRLLDLAPIGLHLARPWRVVVCGPPNVGKSTLINALLGYRRAIVFDQPGTTRDVLTATTALDGWPVELVDTAGLREPADHIESEGVRRAHEQVAGADCLLIVVDATNPADARCFVDAWPGAMVVFNKVDLLGSDLPEAFQGSGIPVSALEGHGIDSLTRSIVARLVPSSPSPGEAVAFTADQVQTLREAADALNSGDSQAASQSLLALLSSATEH